MAITQAGDIVQLVGLDHKYFILKLKPGDQLQTHRGVIWHDDLIGQPFGTEITSHTGNPFYLLQPSTDDLLLDLKRSSQIMYPKDIGLVLMKMAIQPGVRVIEAGTGSGGLTICLAQAVGTNGHVYSYEVREDMQNLARKNLERSGLSERVSFKLQDISAGFAETEADALFLDLPNPWDYLAQAYRALKGGGFFGSILPTVNQVTELLIALRRENFAFIEVCETFLRYYKPVPQRLRPVDRMVAHTGFLIFARTIIPTTTTAPVEGEPPTAAEPVNAPDEASILS